MDQGIIQNLKSLCPRTSHPETTKGHTKENRSIDYSIGRAENATQRLGQSYRDDHPELLQTRQVCHYPD